MAEEQTDISILENIRNEIQKRIDVLTDDVKTLRNISEEKQQDLKQQISSVYQIIEEKLSQIQSIDLNLKDSNQNINDLNARTSSMSDNISSLLQSQNEIKRNIQSLSVDINKIQNDSVNQFNQLNEYTREISKKIAESAKRQERQTREEMVRGPRAAAQASLGITPSAEAKSLQKPEPTQEPESEEKKPRTWAKWFEENAGLLGAAAGAATGVGAGALIGSGPKSAPSGPGYSSSPGEVPSAPPAPNIVGPGVAPGSAPSGPGYSSSPGEVPSDGMSQTLAAQRAARGANNLSDAQKRHMYALAVAEMGSPEYLRKKGIDPKEAYAAFMETPYNRGMTEGRENANVSVNLKKDYYQPLRAGEGKWYNKAYGQLGNTDSELYNLLDSSHRMVAAGSNFSNLGTQNSSAHVADSARRTQTVTTEKYGDTITRKDRAEFSRIHGAGTVKNTKSWLERTQRQAREIDEKSRTQTPSQPSSQAAPQSDASRVPPQSQQSQQPDARRIPINDKGYSFPVTGKMEHRGHGITSQFGYGRGRLHAGADIYATDPETGKLRVGEDAPVYAPIDGQITSIRRNRGRAGNYITMKDANGIEHRFLHTGMPAINPETGKPWRQGDKIKRGAHLTNITGSGTAFGRMALKLGSVNAAMEYFNRYGWGSTNKPHLHYETRINGKPVNPGSIYSEMMHDPEGRGIGKEKKNILMLAGPDVKLSKEQLEQAGQQEQQEQTQQQLFAGDTSESVIAKSIEEEKEKVRREGLTEKQRRIEDGTFNFADESKRRNYYNVKELEEGRSQLTPEQQKKFDKMLIRGPFQTRQSAYLDSILGPGPNWLKKSQQPEPPSSVLDYLPDIPDPLRLLKNLPAPADLLGSALKSVGKILIPSAVAGELEKPIDKSKIDMSDMPGSLDDGGEEGPRTDNRFNPFSPVTYGKSEEKIREMIELAKKAAEAAETAAKTSTENKGPTASGENKPQPPPARQPPTPPGGNQNGNKKLERSKDNGLHSRSVPSSADRYAEVPYT